MIHIIHRVSTIGHNSRPFHRVTHRAYGVMPNITPGGETPPLLVRSPYLNTDFNTGVQSSSLSDYILSMERYIAGDTNHPLVSKFGWGKSPRHAR